MLRTDFDGALGDHGAVGLIDDAVDLLEVVRVRDDLVAADDVLVRSGAVLAPSFELRILGFLNLPCR